jgi:myosin heavy subunit
MASFFNRFVSSSFNNAVCSMEPRECNDLASLDPLTEATLVAMVRARYEEAAVHPFGRPTQEGLIYTRAGSVVIAVNPLCPVTELYTPKKRRKYHDAALASLRKDHEGPIASAESTENPPPHIYEVAARAYHGMREGRCQAAVINGESGAGKTETTKLLLECALPAGATAPLSALS